MHRQSILPLTPLEAKSQQRHIISQKTPDLSRHHNFHLLQRYNSYSKTKRWSSPHLQLNKQSLHSLLTKSHTQLTSNTLVPSKWIVPKKAPRNPFLQVRKRTLLLTGQKDQKPVTSRSVLSMQRSNSLFPLSRESCLENGKHREKRNLNSQRILSHFEGFQHIRALYRWEMASWKTVRKWKVRGRRTTFLGKSTCSNP